MQPLKLMRMASFAALTATLLLTFIGIAISPSLGARQAQRSLTNEDVLKLMRAGVSEQNIFTLMRTHPATFDVSDQARASFDKECAAMKPANVSTGIWATEIADVWEAMKNVVICQETNGRGGEGACDVSPLESSPKDTSAAPTPTPSKVDGRNKYESMPLGRGVTQDSGFANWANSPDKGSPSSAEAKPTANVAGTTPTTQPNRPNVQRQPAQGVIEGFVYWDASTLKHAPANSCSGLSVTVSRGGTPPVTMPDSFAYMGNVGPEAVCKYAVKGLPVDQAVEVQANVTSSEAFSPPALPNGGSKSITITTGVPSCTPGGPVNPSASELSSGWSSCANIASNVNFMIVPAGGSTTPYGTRRAGVGGAVELGPQPDPPKNGTLLIPSSEKTLLGNGSVRALPGSTASPSQTMSAEGSAAGSPPHLQLGATAAGPKTALPSAAERPIAAKESPSVYVANACAKDPAFRVVAVIDNLTGGVHYENGPDPTPPASGVAGQAGNLDLWRSEFDDMVTAGREHTLLGCAFGDLPARGVSGSVARSDEPTAISRYATGGWRVYIVDRNDIVQVEFVIKSWTNNSIGITAPSGTNPNNVSAWAFIVQRPDGTWIVYYFGIQTNS